MFILIKYRSATAWTLPQSQFWHSTPQLLGCLASSVFLSGLMYLCPTISMLIAHPPHSSGQCSAATWSCSCRPPCTGSPSSSRRWVWEVPREEDVVETTSSLAETSSSSPPTRVGSTAGRWDHFHFLFLKIFHFHFHCRWSPQCPPRGRRGWLASRSRSRRLPTGSTARRTTWRWTSGCRSTSPTTWERSRTRVSLSLSRPSRSPVPAGTCSTGSAGDFAIRF